ncbi:MAG: DUF4145 domain-containing protein [Geothrix sp.]|nr:DUF4145 domain-containing protein [Geothrix sp.]
MPIPEFEIKQAHCSNCGLETNHFRVAARSHTVSEPYDEQYDVSWTTTYNMLECCGCGSSHLERLFWCSEWEYGECEKLRFPPELSRRLPKWNDQLAEEEKSLLKEIYTALHADSRRLAVMGTRALLDIFMTRQVGDIGNFKAKLSALEKKGRISTSDNSILQAALDAGHAAAHRGHCPSTQEVNYVIDIIENLFQGDVLAAAADELKKTTPPRKQ